MTNRYYGPMNYIPSQKDAIKKFSKKFIDELSEKYGDLAIYEEVCKSGRPRVLNIYRKGSKSLIASIDLCKTYQNNHKPKYKEYYRKKVIKEVELEEL